MGILVSNLKTAPSTIQLRAGLQHTLHVLLKARISVVPGAAIPNFCWAVRLPPATGHYISVNAFICGGSYRLLLPFQALFLLLKETLLELHVPRILPREIKLPALLIHRITAELRVVSHTFNLNNMKMGKVFLTTL